MTVREDNRKYLMLIINEMTVLDLTQWNFVFSPLKSKETNTIIPLLSSYMYINTQYSNYEQIKQMKAKKKITVLC